jgi:hypothetical protein
MFDWPKNKGNPSQPPLFRGGAVCAAGHASFFKELIARLNVLPPEKGGWGGCLLISQGKKEKH